MNRRFIHAILISSAAMLTAAPAVAARDGAMSPIPGKIHPRLAHKIAESREPVPVWIFFRNKGGENEPVRIDPAARARREGVGFRDDWGDLPVRDAYIRGVEAEGAEVRSTSRWLNGAGATATPEAIRRIARLDYVIRVQPIGRRFSRPEPLATGLLPSPPPPGKTAVDYGWSAVQLAQIRADSLLEAGWSGEGVRVQINDSGFYTAARCYDSLDIAERYDFVHDDTTVSNQTADETDDDEENHGSAVLSVLGGWDEGWIVGPAHDATFYLAKTEDGGDEETLAEEDYWIEAVEWGEARGVRVLSSSVGYGKELHDLSELDGETTPIAIAAQAAVERGVVVCNSQGNEANDPQWRKLVTPADAPGVIAAGAVTVGGSRVYFSSYGPTADGRIKPDVAALGIGVAGVGNPRGGSTYSWYTQLLQGTSFACPLTAGVCALLLEIHPIATPADVMEALHATASQAANPDTALGWGIVNAWEAALRPVVHHDPQNDLALEGDTLRASAALSLYPGFDPPRAVFGDAGGYTDTVGFAGAGDTLVASHLPVDPSSVRYYFLFTRGGRVWTSPEGAPVAYYEFGDATAPSIVHTPLADRTPGEWPARVEAWITDNRELEDDSIRVAYQVWDGGGAPALSGDFSLVHGAGDLFAADFPFDVSTGDSIAYAIQALDGSGNVASSPAGGGRHAFRIISASYALLYGAEGDEGPTNPFFLGESDYRVIFDLPKNEEVRIRVYDPAGRCVRDVYRGRLGPGSRLSVDWDGRDRGGRELSQGVYFLRFEAGPYTKTRKVVVLNSE
ncbi:MAG: S8 family peptidase [Candidatus Eisenbacteria bacterium]|nr:S8 family peptidase [Candidatus Eisenbacteria bacterium]